MAPTAVLLSTIKATRTLPEAITKVLPARQATTTVVTDGSTSGGSVLSGGAIAGIVIGSIAGFLLLWWIVRSCGIMRRPSTWGDAYEPAREKPSSYHHPETSRRRNSHSGHHHHHHHHSRSPRRVDVEVVQPVGYGSRGRSPRAPPAAYYSDGRRRSSDARGYRY
ncbi:hypothetical protein GGR51DRAFT_513408 [Nemania sp. FL0031]|nr:hypothetical protein GGR51DRAFT_513408 [Nemania sp. FL0031]